MASTIRPVTLEDAEALLDLFHVLDSETKFMMIEPGERHTTSDQQRERITAILNAPNSTLLVADAGDVIAGFLLAAGGQANRNRHSAYIVVGIRQAFANQGIGTRLFEALEEWAKKTGIHRLELTVMSHNVRAVHLYEKMGFQSEGIKHHSLCVDGEYVDELYMSKLLE
jgi:RimJ/RimL family protein N-acetyltransferase